MNARLGRWLTLLQRTPLIQYCFHASNKPMVEVPGLAVSEAPRLNLLSPTLFKSRGRIRVAASALLGWGYEADSRTRQVQIGIDVFIGSRGTLLKGCRPGDGCVVAAGAVVSPGFEAPALSIVAANPARVVGQVKPPAAPFTTPQAAVAV